ncbi:MAG: TlpA family protein disulfide reductase, partial [Saprospiraceae bacterium]
PVSLWYVDADYTVMFFWDTECGHCKKAAPFMVDFAKKYKDQSVKVFALCTAITDKAPDCWKSTEEKGFSDLLFLNTYDPYIQSKYKTIYDIRSTPQIFILNRKHEILMKRIGAEQLDEVLQQVMKFEKK